MKRSGVVFYDTFSTEPEDYHTELPKVSKEIVFIKENVRRIVLPFYRFTLSYFFYMKVKRMVNHRPKVVIPS